MGAAEVVAAGARGEGVSEGEDVLDGGVFPGAEIFDVEEEGDDGVGDDVFVLGGGCALRAEAGGDDAGGQGLDVGFDEMGEELVGGLAVRLGKTGGEGAVRGLGIGAG